jgi:hypothetical protein
MKVCCDESCPMVKCLFYMEGLSCAMTAGDKFLRLSGEFYEKQ